MPFSRSFLRTHGAPSLCQGDHRVIEHHVDLREVSVYYDVPDCPARACCIHTARCWVSGPKHSFPAVESLCGLFGIITMHVHANTGDPLKELYSSLTKERVSP